jgi:hypothetical protein
MSNKRQGKDLWQQTTTTTPQLRPTSTIRATSTGTSQLLMTSASILENYHGKENSKEASPKKLASVAAFVQRSLGRVVLPGFDIRFIFAILTLDVQLVSSSSA